jgi:hypothetical protein
MLQATAKRGQLLFSLFTNCREEAFSETELPVYGILGNSLYTATNPGKPYM